MQTSAFRGARWAKGEAAPLPRGPREDPPPRPQLTQQLLSRVRTTTKGTTKK